MNNEKSSEQGGELFGGLLGGIEKLAKLAEELQSSAENISKEGEIDLGKIKEGLKANYSFTVKTATGGASSAGNTNTFRPKTRAAKATTEKPTVAVPREVEPDIDVFEEADAIKIFAQLSGASAQSVSIVLNGDILEITAESAQQRYRKEILLPKKVSGYIQRTFKNGVLEITLALAV
jgi:HSP20 family protein